MTDRDRLIELIQNAVNGCARHWAEIIADYILADGWIRPPCKVGDKVFVVDYTRFGNAIFECEIDEISHYAYGTFYYLNWGLHIPRFKACKEDSFGKTVFLTKEEAEEKLRELKE